MSSYFVGLLVFTCVNVITTAGIYLLIGGTGLVSFGQAGFLAIGAYTSALITTRLALPFPLGLAVAIAASVLVGIAIGYPTLRLRREYFALATMGVGEAIKALISALPEVTGGSVGLPGIPQATSAWLAILLAVLSVALVRNFLQSKYGRNSLALMTDELAAQAIAINTFAQKKMVFAITCGLSGLAGALLAHYVTYIDPSIFSWNRSAELVTIVFLGGLGSLTGGVVAAIGVTLLPEVLRFAAEARFLMYALVVLLVIIYRPGGLFGRWELSRQWLGQVWNRLTGRGAKEGAA
ncbi:MAG: branched-chain amino acid ABC transporter permease [Firmicutes bacterium]|nr:branched-chain amino acid ABC transporter permease [Bacillota bacterium]